MFASANAIASRESARAARAQYDAALAGARPQDRAAASGQVRQAQGAVAEVEAAAAETKIYAPADGEIGRRLAQPGELVPQGFIRIHKGYLVNYRFIRRIDDTDVVLDNGERVPLSRRKIPESHKIFVLFWTSFSLFPFFF